MNHKEKQFQLIAETIDKTVSQAYNKGVEDGKKASLMWQDVATLITIYEQGVDNGDYRRYNEAEWMKEYSQDILRRFNEIRKK